MLTLFGLSITQPLNNAGGIVPGGLITFYSAGTLVLKNTFADADGDTANDNPVELDGYGRAVIFLDNDGAYDIVFRGPNINNVPATGPTYWTLESVVAARPVEL